MSNNRELADLTGETGDQDRSFGSIDTQRETITSEVLRVRNANSQGYEDFKISQYSDIGAALIDAIDTIPNEGGEIKLPAGEHIQTTGVTDARLSRTESLARVKLTGCGANVTVIKLADNIDERQIDYQPANSGGTGTHFFFEMESVAFNGNRANGNTQTSVFIGDVRDVRLDDVFIFESGQYCFRTASQWGYKVTNSIFERANSHGYLMTGGGSPENGYYSACRFGQNDGNGIHLASAIDTTLVGNEYDESAGSGLKLLNGTGNSVLGGTAAQNSNAGVQFDGETGSAVIGLKANANTGAAIEVMADATDCHLDTPQIRNDNISDSGTRTRWNGTIAGGPLGGTDIGALTGASAGDVAMADGTTATNADTLWILKSSGDWQRVDGGATITPA